MSQTSDRDEESISFLISYLQAESRVDYESKNLIVQRLTSLKNTAKEKYVSSEDDWELIEEILEDHILSHLEGIIKEIKDRKITNNSDLGIRLAEFDFSVLDNIYLNNETSF